MEKLPQNCIIINSVVYALVDDFEDGECDRCHIYEYCKNNSSAPCYLFDAQPQYKRFKKVGEIPHPAIVITLDDIAQMMERKNERKVGRKVNELKFEDDYYKNILQGIEECDERFVKMIARYEGISEDEARNIIKEIQKNV